MTGSHAAPIDSQLLPAVELPPGYDNFVLLMAATKGGVGKSTLAINLAVAAAQCGLQSLIIDADSAGEQVSCFNWFEKLRVKGASGPKVIRAAIANVENAINWGKSKGYQVIVIDTGGYDLPSLPRLLDVSNFMLTPALPSPLDLEATAPIRRVWRTSASNCRRGPPTFTTTPSSPPSKPSRKARPCRYKQEPCRRRADRTSPSRGGASR